MFVLSWHLPVKVYSPGEVISCDRSVVNIDCHHKYQFICLMCLHSYKQPSLDPHKLLWNEAKFIISKFSSVLLTGGFQKLVLAEKACCNNLNGEPHCIASFIHCSPGPGGLLWLVLKLIFEETWLALQLFPSAIISRKLKHWSKQ